METGERLECGRFVLEATVDPLTSTKTIKSRKPLLLQLNGKEQCR